MTEFLECHNLNVGYGQRAILTDLHLTVSPAESVLVLGHNGAGKSTLLKTLFGLLPPISGEFSFNGVSTTHASPKTLLLSGLRYLGQSAECFESLRVRQNRRLLPSLYGMSEVSGSFFPHNAQEADQMGHLSIGRRRIEMIKALTAGDPSGYILDEPLSGLDRANQDEFIEWVKSQVAVGKSFVICEHVYTQLASCLHKTLVLRNGKPSYFGESAELFSNGNFAAAFI